jgi:hypothetical protein
MNKTHPATGTGAFVSVTRATQLDEKQVSAPGQLTGISPGADIDDHDDRPAGSPLSRLHAAAPQYRRSLFRR